MTSALESLHAQSQPTRLFFILSGEHASIPAAEVRAILESNSTRYTVSGQSYRLLTLSAPKDALRVVSERSLMYDWCGVSIGECDADEPEIIRSVKSLDLPSVTSGASSFAVRAIRLGGVSKGVHRVKLEREVGSALKEALPEMSVELQNPDLTFACVIHDDKCLLGIQIHSKPSGLIAPRRPRKRPVFHPATMPPKVARLMVNLSRAKPGAAFADPFCGVGGILIEAAVIGCSVVGADASPRMLRGARRNMRHFGLEPTGLLKADARKMPLQALDAVATDPPYGRDSSTMGTKVHALIERFLAGIGDSLKPRAHLCISAPSEVEVETYAREAGLTPKEKYLVRIHRSLTRQFVVLQNK
jgi:tRNA (guanine10-N2)-dimethyltransferase